MNEAKLKAEKLEKLHNDFFSTCEPVKKSEIREKISSLVWELIEATLKERHQTEALAEIQLLKQSNDKPFFLWKLNFPEVFKQQGGFDVVIGNPPYVQIQKFSGQQIQKDLEQQNYTTFAKTGDIYCLFYEKANRLLRDNGLSCFITSNKWMRAGYGKKLRHYFLNQLAIHQLIDFGDSPIFKEATTYTNIMLSSKSQQAIQTKAWDISNSYLANTSLEAMLNKAGQSSDFFNDDGFVIVPEKLGQIKKRIEAVGTPLKDWDISIYRGILTGFNEAFIIDGEKKDELIAKDPKSAEIIKPILRGRDIKRYQADFSDLWLIATFPALKINIGNYPAIKEYLEEYLPKIKQTGELFINKDGKKEKSRKKTGNQWFETQDQISYYQEFEKEKIIYPNMTSLLPFCYKKGSFLTNQKCFILTGESLKYLTSFLNTDLFKFAFKDNFPKLMGDTYELSKIFFDKIPILKITETEQQPFINLVDYILLAKENDLKLQTAYFEEIIDGLVFELYFSEEINTANKSIFKHLGELKPINEKNRSSNLGLYSEAEKIAIIQTEFDRLYHPNHPVRNNLETLDSIEEIKIIKESLQ